MSAKHTFIANIPPYIGGEFNPTSMSNRVLGTAYWYFSLVVVAVYTANLAAFLTSGRLATPIESLSDLANQDQIPYGTVKESSLEAFFKVCQLEIKWVFPIITTQW